ncbi:unnamed protein product [Rotaria magnacalcarata]|uniref:Uncharacterized protein n=1 Tax=Rotaria magnacalcarata TaxID=392030 RepID=A0A816SS20_9BILA|nr:unnamed protein product [Rotaria magnacalcarata]CAF2155109.1 unnamed protein product [Rotaria magnacalcarata]CAF4216024.1 unnamed protein product [Rotaria magnacalcarata]CAF4231980.1 unnamed protein product [Rotaria magnacalcarata]
MDLHLSYLNDIVTEEKKIRKSCNDQRRNNYKFRVNLSKNIELFKKKKMKQLNITKTGPIQSNMYLKIKEKNFCMKKLTRDAENLSFNNSSQEVNRYDALNCNPQKRLEDEFNADPIDDNISFYESEFLTPYDNDESEIDYSTDENEDNESIDQMESELHPFTHVSTKDTMFEFLRLIRGSQISKKESENLLSFIKSLLPFPNQMPNNMNKLLIGLGTINYFNKKTICILCEKEFQYNQRSCNECIKKEKKYIAHIFDTNVQALISNIVSRHWSDIENYRKMILNPDPQTIYDIPFGKAYQNLMKQYSNENLLSLLFHVDGISFEINNFGKKLSVVVHYTYI